MRFINTIGTLVNLKGTTTSPQFLNQNVKAVFMIFASFIYRLSYPNHISILKNIVAPLI